MLTFGDSKNKKNEAMLTMMQQSDNYMSTMTKTLQQMVDHTTSAGSTTSVHTLPGGLSADVYEVHAPGEYTMWQLI